MADDFRSYTLEVNLNDMPDGWLLFAIGEGKPVIAPPPVMDEIKELRSKLDAILAAIRHCAGESSFDSFNFKGGGYCSECGRSTKAGHEALCWRRFAFEETPR